MGVVGIDSLHQRTGRGVIGYDGAGVNRGIALIQPQFGLPFIAILTVAVETVFGQDRTDVAVEIHCLLCERNMGQPSAGKQHEQRQPFVTIYIHPRWIRWD